MARNKEQEIRRRRSRWSLAIWSTAALLLLIPLVAMQFHTGVNWSGFDFVFMGVLLAIVCGCYELAIRLSDSIAYRAGAGIAVVTGFLTIVINGVVGMLGSEHNPANLLFGLVLLVGVIGALIACFRPQGMARAMYATAFAQAAMVVYALVAGYSEVVLHVEAFVIPWAVSAGLFQKAAREVTA
jgi:hypothetical protein